MEELEKLDLLLSDALLGGKEERILKKNHFIGFCFVFVGGVSYTPWRFLDYEKERPR